VSRLGELRGEVNRQIEQLRNDGKVGGSLDAEVTLAPDTDSRTRLADVESELRFFFITSESASLRAMAPGPFGRRRPTEHAKCVRCWHHRADVGARGAPGALRRCVENVAGDGETRRWF
jgi:isoleucyl-tRNA synthetase